MKVFEKNAKLWRYYSDNKIVEALPPHLDISLTNYCNLNCKHCPYHGPDAILKQDPCDMDFELYQSIINEAAEKNVASVKLSCTGEPLEYPYFFEAVEFAKNRGLKTSINSNGMLLTYDNCVQLIKSRLDVIIISDYGFREQIKGICILNIQKQIFKSLTPYILVKTNHPERFNDVVNECVPIEFDDYTNLQEDHEKREFECGFPWQRLLITADGSAHSCACGIGLLVDAQNSYLGNVRGSTLEALWNSVKMNFLRVAHENHESHLLRMCRLCPIRRREIEKGGEKK